jgi:uncharacterized membrane protein
MNDTIFRRDRISSVPPAAQLSLRLQDASRAFLPEPPAQPLAAPVVPAQQASGGEGDASYAQNLVRVWGPTRAINIARAEGRVAAAELIQQAVEDTVAMAVTLAEAREAGLL